jgi:hypothetical protein
MKWYLILCNEPAVFIDKGMVVLQNYRDMLKVVPSSCCETCLTSDDRNLIIDTKGEDVADAQAEDDPLLVTPQVIKTGCEVSYVSVFIVSHISQICRFTDFLNYLHIPLCVLETVPLL